MMKEKTAGTGMPRFVVPLILVVAMTATVSCGGSCADNILACASGGDWLIMVGSIVVLIPLSIWAVKEFLAPYPQNRTAEMRDEVQSILGGAQGGGIVKGSIPAFLLPTGSDAENFRCVFDFDQVLAMIKPGVQAGGTMGAVWAGRDDFRTEGFGERLRDEFARQFVEYKQNTSLKYNIRLRVSPDPIVESMVGVVEGSTKIQVHIHPVLRTLVDMLCEADSVPHPRQGRPDETYEIPDVRKYLRTTEYVNEIAPEYRPLLDSLQ